MRVFCGSCAFTDYWKLWGIYSPLPLLCFPQVLRSCSVSSIVWYGPVDLEASSDPAAQTNHAEYQPELYLDRNHESLLDSHQYSFWNWALPNTSQVFITPPTIIIIHFYIRYSVLEFPFGSFLSIGFISVLRLPICSLIRDIFFIFLRIAIIAA